MAPSFSYKPRQKSILALILFSFSFAAIAMMASQAHAAGELCTSPAAYRCNGNTNLEQCLPSTTIPGMYTWYFSKTCTSGCDSSTNSCKTASVCSNGQTQSQSCTISGCSGTQTRTCSSGQWGSWGSCAKSDACCGISCSPSGYYCSGSNSEYRTYRCSGGSCSYSTSGSTPCANGCDSGSGRCKEASCSSSAGWACYNSNTEAYKNPDCSWTSKKGCGASYCDAWGNSYCGGNNVVQARTCYDKACSYSTNRCSSTTRSEIQTVQNCGNKLCSDAKCVNRAPNYPTQVSPINNQIVQTINPTLTWQQATDPDNDAITQNRLVITRVKDGMQVLNKEFPASASYTIQPSDTTCCSNGQHTWRIYAYDGTVWSSQSPEQSFTVQTNKAPNPPTNPRPSNGETVSSFNPTFTWSQATDPENDIITKNRIMVTSDYDNRQLYTYEMPAGTSYTSSIGLSNGQYYRWTVAAYDGNTWGQAAAEQKFKVDIQNKAPNPPIPAYPATYTTIKSLTPEITWQQGTDPEGDTITQNRIIIRKHLGLDQVLYKEISAATKFSVPIHTLSDNTEYEWSVYAFDGTTWSLRSEWQIFKVETSNPAPNAPAPIFPKNGIYVSTTKPTFNWTQATDPNGDAIQMNRLFIKEWVPVGSPTAGKQVFLQEFSARESFAIPSDYTLCCANNQKYVWQIAAYDGITWGSYSAEAEFMPYLNNDKPPYPPAIIYPEDNSVINNPAPLIKWQNAVDPEGDLINSYSITITRAFGDKAQILTAELGNINSFQIGNDKSLANGKYEIALRAKSNEVVGSWGKTYFTVNLSVPPDNVILQSPANNSYGPVNAQFSWTQVYGATSYIIAFYNDVQGSQLVESANTIQNSYVPAKLQKNKKYFWRVWTQSSSGISRQSDVYAYNPAFCSANADCGTDKTASQPYCNGNSIKQGELKFTCMDADTKSARCTNYTFTNNLQNCTGDKTGCYEAKCQRIECNSDLDCESEKWMPFCSNSKPYYNITHYSCKNSGTPSSFCQTSNRITIYNCSSTSGNSVICPADPCMQTPKCSDELDCKYLGRYSETFCSGNSVYMTYNRPICDIAHAQDVFGCTSVQENRLLKDCSADGKMCIGGKCHFNDEKLVIVPYFINESTNAWGFDAKTYADGSIGLYQNLWEKHILPSKMEDLYTILQSEKATKQDFIRLREYFQNEDIANVLKKGQFILAGYEGLKAGSVQYGTSKNPVKAFIYGAGEFNENVYLGTPKFIIVVMKDGSHVVGINKYDQTFYDLENKWLESHYIIPFYFDFWDGYYYPNNPYLTSDGQQAGSYATRQLSSGICVYTHWLDRKTGEIWSECKEPMTPSEMKNKAERYAKYPNGVDSMKFGILNNLWIMRGSPTGNYKNGQAEYYTMTLEQIKEYYETLQYAEPDYGGPEQEIALGLKPSELKSFLDELSNEQVEKFHEEWSWALGIDSTAENMQGYKIDAAIIYNEMKERFGTSYNSFAERNEAANITLGCNYNDPPCGINHTCTNNQCVLKSGCDYNNPACGIGYSCQNNQCIPKQGCQYNNPTCGSNYACQNNQCVLKTGCNFNNPPCLSNSTCTNNQCIKKTGCQYNNPSCSSDSDCANNQCVKKQGCQYNNPACANGFVCQANQCVKLIKENRPPVITSKMPSESYIRINERQSQLFRVAANDTEALRYYWFADGKYDAAKSGSGSYLFITGNSTMQVYQNPLYGNHTIKAIVSDGQYNVTNQWALEVVPYKQNGCMYNNPPCQSGYECISNKCVPANRQPVITGISPSGNPARVAAGTVTLRVDAYDPDGDYLSYSWYRNGVLFASDNVTQAFFAQGQYKIKVIVKDSSRMSASKAFTLNVVNSDNKADLVAKNIVLPKAPPRAGQNFPVTLIVENSGNRAANFYVTFVDDETGTSFRQTTHLPAKYSRGVRVMRIYKTPGQHKFSFYIDKENYVPELNENNNYIQGTVVVS